MNSINFMVLMQFIDGIYGICCRNRMNPYISGVHVLRQIKTCKGFMAFFVKLARNKLRFKINLEGHSTSMPKFCIGFWKNIGNKILEKKPF